MIGVTGANGYLGGRILSRLRAGGLEAIALVRRPDPDDERARRFALGQPLDSSLLDGIETVVHAAWDLSCRGPDVHSVNCAGSLPLLDGVAARGGRVVLISSLSAFADARSDYGRAKFALERAVLQRGGVALRPGLVFGIDADGLFGAMVDSISRSTLTPMIGGGRQRLFITHDRSLCELVAAIVSGRVEPDCVLFAANEIPTTLRAIALHIAQSRARRLRVLPIPPALAYAGLRSLELAGVPVPFRSDSLRSLSHPIPFDEVAALARADVDFPPLRQDLWVG